MTEKLTLTELSKLYGDDDKARTKLEQLRWNGEAFCPREDCGSYNVYRLIAKDDSVSGGRKGEDGKREKGGRKGLWKCATCRKQFTVTVGTIFEGSRIPLGKWLMAIHKICSSKKGISALQLSRELELTYKTAWFMAHRIRYGMSQEPMRSKLTGTVEADETYIGGKSKNMHPVERKRRIAGSGSHDQAPVVTLVEREGTGCVKTIHMEHVTAANIKKVLRDCVSPNNAFLMTDEAPVYKGAEHMLLGHQSVNHSEKEYVRGSGGGAIHVNTAESVHALLKRGVMGTYHHWSKKHLHRYLAEFDFRWNHRKVSDSDRTLEAIKLVGGKRLVYSMPTNKK